MRIDRIEKKRPPDRFIYLQDSDYRFLILNRKKINILYMIKNN